MTQSPQPKRGAPKWEFPRPSAFVPFLRRFTDERARDRRELEDLYARVREMHENSAFSHADARTQTIDCILEHIEEDVAIPEALAAPLIRCLDAFLERESPLYDLPEIDFDKAISLQEQAELRRFLRSKEWFHDHEREVFERLVQALYTVFAAILEHMPPVGEDSLFSAELYNVLPEPQDLMDKCAGTLAKERYANVGLFTQVTETVYRNACRYSKLEPFDHTKPPIPLGEAKLGTADLVETYLDGTPFQKFFSTPVPLHVPQELLFSHMHVVGGSGAGKTQWLQQLILHHLEQEDPPALVVVDSQGDMINKLLRLQLFDPDNGRFGDRLIHITPKDIEYPPAINVFDVPRERFENYDEATREQIVAGVIDLFDYLFRGLLADLTAKQSVFFRMVARLLLTLPDTLGRNATIMDILYLMEDPAPYQPAIDALPDIHRRFFEQDFNSKAFNQTKEQIRYRLNAILENPTLYRLFTSPKTKVDLFSEINRGSIILVDTAKDFLKGGSAYFGRIFISLVLQAVYERAAIPEDERHPAFLIVDEAAEYFDVNIDDLLTEARKYKLGCVFAHQYMDQCTHQLRASLAANTSIKMASNVSTSDARQLAPDLRTTPEFILAQDRLNFACHIRGVTSNAINMTIETGMLNHSPAMSTKMYKIATELNRRRVSSPETQQNTTEPRRDESSTKDPIKTSNEW